MRDSYETDFDRLRLDPGFGEALAALGDGKTGSVSADDLQGRDA